MAIKNFYRNRVVEKGSMDADILSPTIDISRLDNIAVQINWSAGDPTGSFELLQSIDNINFVKAVSSIQTIAGSGSSPTGSLLWSASGICYPFIQIMYDKTSGDGLCDIWVSGKEI
jgi:hypothetical protein